MKLKSIPYFEPTNRVVESTNFVTIDGQRVLYVNSVERKQVGKLTEVTLKFYTDSFCYLSKEKFSHRFRNRCWRHRQSVFYKNLFGFFQKTRFFKTR